MTRLAMQRELPFDAESAVIDFVPLSQQDHRTVVLAVAAPQQILDHAKEIARAAKLGVERISLRSMGSALILKHLGDEPRNAVLAVDITSDSIEFCVVEKGLVRFSRAAELATNVQPEDLAEAVITETRRTWMSYRLAEGSEEIRHVLVMGDPRVCVEAAEPLGEMLRVEAEVLNAHPLVEANGNDVTRVWPLIGLLLESGHGGQTIDFAHPRKAPDLAAQRRKRMLFAAGAILVLLFGLWTFANRDLQKLESELERMQSLRGDLLPEFHRNRRDAAKLRHIEHWEAVQINWLDHLAQLAAMAPMDDLHPPPIVLDSWRGQQRFTGVEFSRRSREWSAPMQVSITLGGEARDRRTADEFRAALVSAEVYATSSTGPDSAGGRRLPYGFAYRLQTNVGSLADGDTAADEFGDASGGARE
jgi:hypothetical protein